MLTGRKPEWVADVLLRVDWEVEEDHFVEATSLKNLGQVLASIDGEGGTVVRIIEVEPLEA